MLRAQTEGSVEHLAVHACQLQIRTEISTKGATPNPIFWYCQDHSRASLAAVEHLSHLGGQLFTTIGLAEVLDVRVEPPAIHYGFFRVA